MPTGWRPEDVKLKMPLNEILDPNNQVKYRTDNSILMIAWSWFQHIIAGLMMFHLI